MQHFFLYSEAQLDFTLEIEVFHMMFERCDTKNRKRSIKEHIKYFNFRCYIQLDLPVELPLLFLRRSRVT